MNENRLKSYFAFTKNERIAIITIVSMIVIILVIKYLIITNPPKMDYFKHDLDSIVARREFVMDSIRVADSIERNKKMKKDKACLVPTGNSSKKQKTKQEVTRKDNTCVVHHEERAVTIVDLNTSDTTILKQLPGIGSAFAKWIVEYRTKLGGYCESEQLLEVYKMDTARYEGIKDYVRIDSAFMPNKLKINLDAFKTLVKHPYLEYEDVKKIVNHREQKGFITSWQQLKTIVGDAINPRLKYYVDYQ